SKVQSSWIVANTVDRESLPKVLEMFKELANDKSPVVAHRANTYLLVVALRNIAPGKPEEAKAVVSQVAEALGKESADELLPQIAMSIPSMLENAGFKEL